jgi:hypothetical protein
LMKMNSEVRWLWVKSKSQIPAHQSQIECNEFCNEIVMIEDLQSKHWWSIKRRERIMSEEKAIKYGSAIEEVNLEVRL